MQNRLIAPVRLHGNAIPARLPVSGVRGGMSLTRLLFMGASSHTVLMIRGGNSNSRVDEFHFIPLFLLITYHIPFLSFRFFEKTTYLFGAGSSPHLSVACLRTKSQDIFIFYFVTVTYSSLFSAFTHLTHLLPVIYHLSLSS